uniref:Uncharacterized protein n=1 Tax=Globodera rostochiensis TaxID=31243 RepID=A0A914HWA7_GLORO
MARNAGGDGDDDDTSRRERRYNLYFGVLLWRLLPSSSSPCQADQTKLGLNMCAFCCWHSSMAARAIRHGLLDGQDTRDCSGLPPSPSPPALNPFKTTGRQIGCAVVRERIRHDSVRRTLSKQQQQQQLN